ncbi:hypothetical protein M9H77_18852 [Catharanthus roseus]|uniref:Uncharacterized protein n=1 Tax=Catharanthus roseus TaxID=4058 RepID=A0ACC0B8R1_CATRO|nr:hypothetical protein M9H77_18852 [Catharanthus roseus]
MTVHNEKCQWNLVNKSVVEGKRADWWALIDFTSNTLSKLHADGFIKNLTQRSRHLGMHMEEPVFCKTAGMNAFASVKSITDVLESVINHSKAKSKGPLQIIICVMADKHPVNKGNDQYLANLCLKINAKLGGCNVQLNERLPHFLEEDCVMFIETCPSITAVVGTVNWPAANRYVAMIKSQEHRKEKIVNFSTMCNDLINTFEQLNKIKPKKIVVFRDGVNEGQFDMVLNEELLDLKQTIRLFLEGASANVPLGTVVDTKIVHPFEFDFYLCSHYGSIGASLHTIFYADLVAYWAHMFQEVLMDSLLDFTDYARISRTSCFSFEEQHYGDLSPSRSTVVMKIEVATSGKALNADLISFPEQPSKGVCA